MSNTTKGIVIASLIKETYSMLNSSIKKEFKNTELTVPQIMIIGILSKNKQMKVSDISDEMYLTNATVSGIIDRLEKQVIVKRLRSEEDKRIVYIELTDSGKEYANSFRGVIDNYFSNLFGCCSEQDIESIITGLELLKNIIINEENNN